MRSAIRVRFCNPSYAASAWPASALSTWGPCPDLGAGMMQGKNKKEEKKKAKKVESSEDEESESESEEVTPLKNLQA